MELEVLEHAGPRIVCLRYRDSSNLFGDVSDYVIPTEFGDYHMWGGHRLWHAPEAMPRTYYPDDAGSSIAEISDGLLLEGQIEPHTGIRKTIEIHLAKDRPKIILVHSLVNCGDSAIELAPWPITQFRLGGIVIAPMPVGRYDPDGLLPNRHISLWPYTRIRDPRLHWDDDFLLLRADAGLPPLKFGYFNHHGWLAYLIDGVLFRKTFGVTPDAPHPDGNCNAEVFCGDRFAELESLAPLSRIAPGEQVQATETWDVFESLEQLGLDEVIARLDQ